MINNNIVVWYYCSGCKQNRAISKEGWNLNLLKDYQDIVPLQSAIAEDLSDAGNKPFTIINYYEYINSQQWKERRQAIMVKYNYTCQICFSDANEVHHLTYANLSREFDFELIPLCKECHNHYYHKGKHILT
jgi:hypothetical protein